MIVSGYVLPDVIVLGAAKCGTTTLSHYLSSSKDVARVMVKEPHYFVYRNVGDNFAIDKSNQRQHQGYVHELRNYSELFNPRLINIDFSTHYLYNIDEFVTNIKALYGDYASSVKFVIILRDPVERALSHYKMKIRDGHETLGVEEAFNRELIAERLNNGFIPSFDYLGFSSYKRPISILKNEGWDVTIYDFQFFLKSPGAFYSHICSVIGIKDFEFRQRNVVYNKSGQKSTSLIGKFLYHLLFSRNILKRLMPKAIKAKLATLKDFFANVALDPIKVSTEDYAHVASLLSKEIEFYYGLDFKNGCISLGKKDERPTEANHSKNDT